MSHDDHDHASETSNEKGFETFDDVAGFTKVLNDTMQRGYEILAIANRGFTNKDQIKKFRSEIPELVSRLRQLLVAQLDKFGEIRKLDLKDGSYDNVGIDDALRKMLTSLRNLHTNLNTMIGTRTVRKLSGFIVEDIPNLFTVKWRQLKDNVKQFSKTGALVTGAAGVTALAGYSIVMGDIGTGASLLGQHLGIAASKSLAGLKIAAPYAADAAHNVRHAASWTFGKLSALLHPGAALAHP